MNSKAIKRQLLAAIAMVLVAAIALGSSTYAWFVGNNTVKAEGMKVQAQTESGILIKSVENTSDTFSTIANAGMTDATKLYPTSTINLSDWYHAVSDTYDDEKSQQDAEGAYTEVADGSLDSYRVKKTFIIRSADAKLPLTGMDLAVTEVTANNATTNTVLLNQAVRVGVKVTGEDQIYVYAPQKNSAFTLTAVYADGDELTEKHAPVDGGDRLPLSATHSNTIPANTDGLVVEVYIWYEGEDEQCKTSNLPFTTQQEIDKLDVTISFKAIEKQTQGS